MAWFSRWEEILFHRNTENRGNKREHWANFKHVAFETNTLVQISSMKIGIKFCKAGIVVGAFILMLKH